MNDELRKKIEAKTDQRRRTIIQIGSYGYKHGWDAERSKNDGWDLGKGSAGWSGCERTQTRKVKFDTSFNGVPKVSVSLSGIDVAKSPLRIRLWAENVSAEGFDLKIFTWLDSEIYGIEVQWIAIGA